MTLHRVLREFMMAPLFPVPPEVFKAKMEYRDFKGGETLTPAVRDQGAQRGTQPPGRRDRLPHRVRRQIAVLRHR